MDEYMGTIKIFAGNFVPKDWMACEGQILPISQWNALFSLLGTTYGGNGQTTFALPDLRCGIPVGINSMGNLGFPLKALGEVGSSSVHGSFQLRTLGIMYIICVRGIYPSRW